MKRIAAATAALALMLGTVGFAAGAEQTWTGIISDSHCGALHKSDIEHGGRITAKECVVGRAGDPNIPGCVSPKNGAKFVVVVGEKVYQVANQDFTELRTLAADNVRVTGTLSGDVMTVSKIVKLSK